MKNKLLLSLGLLVGTLGMGLYATPEEATAGPGFDFINKTKNPVFLILINNDQNLFQCHEVKPAKIMPIFGKTMAANNFSATIDTSKKTILGIVINAKTRMEALAVQGGPNTIVYTFTPNKDIYVTFRENNQLTPQTGPSSGKKGITEAGYSLKNIITQSGIILKSPPVK